MRFYTDDLLDRWGFDDGDVLDLFLDHYNLTSRIYHKDLLVKVVKKFVIPELDQIVEVSENFSSGHNCARAITVDGIDSWENMDIQITPEFVDIEDEMIVEFIKNIK